MPAGRPTRPAIASWPLPAAIAYSLCVLIATCMFFAVVGAGLGWWKDTRILYRRPGSKWVTDVLPPGRMPSSVLARRRRKRLVTTAEFAVYAAALGAGIFWALQHFTF